MHAAVISVQSVLKKGQFGNQEPPKTELLPDDFQFDVIIVPVLGFDADGFRLGYGKGHYDRFLAKQAGSLTIGLAYQDGFIADGLPHEPHDIPLSLVITEERIHEFKI